ncbi:hypothetical protein L7F22_019051 [Adiantum nelumboides]|nr:hypothetical protein [Adiantum nelumboides]
MAGTTLLGNPIAGCAGAIKCATKAGLMKSHVIGHNLTPEQRSRGVQEELEKAKQVGKSGVKYAAFHTVGFMAQTGTRVISSGAQVRKTASRHGAADEAYPNHNHFDSFTHKAHQKKKELSEDRKETRRQTFQGMTDMMKGKEPVYDPRH